MKKAILMVLMTALVFSLSSCGYEKSKTNKVKAVKQIKHTTTAEQVTKKQTDEPKKDAVEVYTPTEEDIAEEEYYDSLSLLAELVHAEAGNQDLKGKRLVADVVLNRVDSDRFPNTIEDVIYQDHQFTTVLKGTIYDAGWDMTDEDYQAVMLEVNSGKRLDSEILFFTAGRYNKYCIPMYKYGDHYFGK